MHNKFTKYLLILLLALAIIVGLFSAYKRITIESKSSNIEFAMDWQDIKKLSVREGISTDDLLYKLKRSGLTSIAFTEDTLDSLELEGKLSWITGYEQNTLLKLSKKPVISGRMLSKSKKMINPGLKTPLRNFNNDPSFSYVISNDYAVFRKIKKELDVLLGKERSRYLGSQILEIKDDEEDLMILGLGISEDKFKNAIEKGFYVIPRLRNNFRLNESKFNEKLKNILSNGPVKTVIFAGEEVAGFKNNIKDISKVLKNFSINYGYIEMTEQKGDSELLKNLKYNILRVHSISEEEMQKKMSKEEALDRFERAVSERGVRILYIRPFYIADKGKDLIETNIAYLADLKNRITNASFSIGEASNMQKISAKTINLILLTMGVCAGGIFLFNGFIPLSNRYIFLALLFSGSLPILFAENILLYQKLAALMCAIIFPALAITSVFKQEKIMFMSLSKSIAMAVKIFLVSLAGAVLIIGLLLDTLFMVGAQQFIGIKIAFIAPIIICIFYASVLARESIKNLKTELLKFLNFPITVGTIIFGLLLLGFFALYLTRSGNFGIGVLESEKTVRTLLENILIVRPRTKEFLIGYPFLILASIYYLKGNKKWLWLLLSIGIVGPISTLNTFCHIHSPVLISLLRALYGLVLGILFGVVYYGAFLLIMSKSLTPTPLLKERGKS